MNFKPSRMKVAVSIVIVIAWYAFLWYISQGVPILCIETACNFDFSIIAPLAMCHCPSVLGVLWLYIEILLPGLFAYAVLSLAEN